MRRVLFGLLAAGLAGIVAGCCHSHGNCDCDVDDYCSSRAPWLTHDQGVSLESSTAVIPVTPRVTDKK